MYMYVYVQAYKYICVQVYDLIFYFFFYLSLTISNLRIIFYSIHSLWQKPSFTSSNVWSFFLVG